MPRRATRLTGPLSHGAGLDAAFADIRTDLDVRQEWPPEVLEEARRAMSDPDLPEGDETDLELVTIDPPGSMDLDQALHVARDGSGYRVRYAIADVPAFVRPGGPLDAETRRRGQTIYCPDERVPLHPAELSEGAASLLPGQVRPAYLWDIRLDASGERAGASVARAMVRSRRRYTYAEVQEQVDTGSAEESLLLLREVGRLRIERESARGGASLPMPEQEVHVTEDGGYRLQLRPLLDSEDWNAQISLLTGIVGAHLMLEGGVGLLRTMPPAQDRDVARFRRQAQALGVPWAEGMAYGDFLRTLDRDDPIQLAVIHDATSLFRGAGYTPFDGERPERAEQAAIAAPYAHVTAPLRRLVDRFGLVVCAALCAGQEVPVWVREVLPELPDLMAESDRTARAVDRACVGAVQAALLAGRVGETFAAVVVDDAGRSGWEVQLRDPAVTATALGEADLGQEVQVRLTEADVTTRTVSFEVVGEDR